MTCTNCDQMNETPNLNLATITRYDLPHIERPKFPKGCIRGEFRNHEGKYVCDIYVLNHRVYLARAREFGNGEIVHMVPGSFDPKDFERAGGLQWTSSQYVKFWRFRLPVSAMVAA